MEKTTVYDEEMVRLADEYYEEGRQRLFGNRLDEAALLIQNALHLYKQCENYEKYTAALNFMGVIYATTGNETMAVNYYIEGLECANEHGIDNVIALLYNNIGSRYQELGEHEKAIDYFMKSARELEKPGYSKEERYASWCLVTYINLAASYRHMEKFELAEKYLMMAEDYLTPENDEVYRYTFLIFECLLWWATGKRERVYEHMEELLKSGVKDRNASDYVQDMRDLCSLLKDMKEYDAWKNIIIDFQKYADEQNTVYFRLLRNELWRDYYKTIDDRETYIKLCVEYIELHQKQAEITNKERASAIDIKIQLREKEMERRQAEELSTTDALTGLGNRYLLAQDLSAIVREATKKQEKIAIGVLDIDCFKQHNDTYGHIKGDSCIKDVAKILQEALGGVGKSYRFGGDEFIVVLPQGNREIVEQIAKRIQDKLGEANIENINSNVIPEVTISQGYAYFIPKEGEEMDALIEHADHALYFVKENGRNSYYIIEK